ncbi:hypothetical protein BBJ28_00023060, partial [Nothophytophthora sp. Chile5]
NQYEADQTEQLQFEAERIDTEMHHVAVSLENVVAEKSEIESTIEDQCRSEFAVREQLLEEKESVEEEVRELERKLKLKLERVQEIQSSIDNAQRDIDTVRGRYSRQLKRIADREEGILKTKAEVEADGEQLTSQRQEFHQQMEQYSEDIATIGKRIGTVKKEMRAAALLANVLEVQETRREQSIIRKKQQTAELSSLNDAAAVAEQSFTMLTNQHEELEKSLSIHRNAIASAESMIPRLEQEKKASAAQRNFKEAARISKDIKGLEKDRGTAEEMVEVVEMELQDLKERIDKREVEFEEKKKELKEMEQHLELATLQEMWKEAKHLRTALRKIERCKSEGVAADDGIDFRSSAMLLVQAEYDACMLQVETLEKKYDVSDSAKEEEDEEEEEDEDESIDGEEHEVEQRVDTRLSNVGRLDAEGSDGDVEAVGDSSSVLEEIASQLSDLEAQIEKATVNEEYELAARLDEKIEALKRRQQAIESSIVQDSTADAEEETTEDAVEESNEEEYYAEEDVEEMEYGHEEMLSPVSGVQSQEELTHTLETIQLRVVMLEKQIELATENEDYETAAIYDEELLSLREEEQSIHSQLQGSAAADSGVFGGMGMKSNEAAAVVQEPTEVESPVNAAVDSTSGGLGGSSLFGGLQMSSGPAVAQEAPVSAESDAEGEDASAQEAENAETASGSPTKVEMDSPTSYSSSVMKDSFFGNPQAASLAAPSASGSLFGGLQMSGSFQVSTPSVSSPEKESPAGSVSSREEERSASDSATAADNVEESSVVAPPATSDMFGGLQLSSSAVKASAVEATTSDDMFGGLQLSSSAVAAESAVETAPASEPSSDMFGGLQLSSSAVAASEETNAELSTSVNEAEASVSSVKSVGDTRMSIQELSEHSENGATTVVLGGGDASSHADTATATSVSETTSTETTTTTTSTTVTTHTKVSEEEEGAETGFEDAQQEAAQPEAMGRKKLGVVSLALITYFNVSGGPWGSEPIVAACGPFVGILATLIFPFIWCLPLALSFAELFSAFPTDSSFCTWVGKAFGRPMGFHVGYWSWVSGVIDNAIYPCLMVDSVYAVVAGPHADPLRSFMVPTWMYLVRVTVATMFMLPTIFSIDAVGRFLLVLGLAMVAPFVVLVIVSVPQLNPDNWFVVSPTPHWSQLASVLYWSYSGFDAAGAYASEIESPRQTYPRAMMLTVALVALTYSVPFLAASGVNKPPYNLWADGYYPIIAEQISGPMLRTWFLGCALLGNLGVYIAKMTKNGFLLAGMADLGLAPNYFIKRTASNGVPRRAILLSYGIIVFMALFDFNVILGVDNFLSSLACVTELCAVVRLRFTMPTLPRPYKVSLSDRALLLVMVGPFAIGSFVLLNEFTKSPLSMALNVAALASGLLCHRLLLRKAPASVYSPLAAAIQLELGTPAPGAAGIVAPAPTELQALGDQEQPRYKAV